VNRQRGAGQQAVPAAGASTPAASRFRQKARARAGAAAYAIIGAEDEIETTAMVRAAKVKGSGR
jgi:hypothetical protein